MLIFVEGGKPENQEKNSQCKDKNQHQTFFIGTVNNLLSIIITIINKYMIL